MDRTVSPGRPRVGYTAGIFDMFHVGHLNLLHAARDRCDYLVVGVTTDELAAEAGRPPVVTLLERLSIVESVRYVDHVVPQVDRDKLAAWRSLRFDVLFAGDTLRSTREWVGVERDLSGAGVAVEFLPSTYAPGGGLLARGLDDLLEE